MGKSFDEHLTIFFFVPKTEKKIIHSMKKKKLFFTFYSV